MSGLVRTTNQNQTIRIWTGIKMSDPYLPAGWTQDSIDLWYGEEPNEVTKNEFGELCERCRLCKSLISIEDHTLPLDEGVCSKCMWGDEE